VWYSYRTVVEANKSWRCKYNKARLASKATGSANLQLDIENNVRAILDVSRALRTKLGTNMAAKLKRRLKTMQEATASQIAQFNGITTTVIIFLGCLCLSAHELR
jgi:uncharacterized phage infection (PIP) family protein YhgE